MKNDNNKELTDEELEICYANFIKELTKISRKYQIAIQASGCICKSYTKNNRDFKELTYTDDPGSGDLYAKFPSENEMT